MTYNFTPLKEKTKEINNWLKKEFSKLRTGSASIALLDDIKIENYGSLSPLNQVANLAVEDARTIRISPWDSTQIPEIEKTLRNASLGVAVMADSQGVRISFPQLTGESRQALIKTAKDKLEKAKISLRIERDKIWEDIQAQEKLNEISQDDKFQLKEEMQKIIDNASQELTEIFNKKEKEIK